MYYVYILTNKTDTHMITEEEYKDKFAKCSKIRKLLISSITTEKGEKQ